jgi:signal transduction histidine kinase/ActR/RegA family two-component response regulator
MFLCYSFVFSYFTLQRS